MGKEKRFSFVYRFLPYLLLFVYFVCFSPSVTPEFFGGLFSTKFVAWVAVLPIILITLCILGVVGVAHIWQAKRRRTAYDPKYGDFARIAAFGLICFLVALVIGAATHFTYTHQKFDANTWRDQKSTWFYPDKLTLRQQMVNDLTENVLPGLSRTEIETLLGEAKWSHETDDGGNVIEYYLGPESGLGIDNERLYIEFDSSGNFVSCGIRTD